MRLTEDVSELLYAEADAWWSGEGDGPAELARALERVVALYREHGVLLRAVVEASAYDEVVAGFWRALVGRFVEATPSGGSRPSRPRGGSGRCPPRETAFALAWMTERACYQRLVARPRPALPAGSARGVGAIWPTRPWMNALAPVLRPAFTSNHHKVMRQGAEGLAALLGATLVAAG